MKDAEVDLRADAILWLELMDRLEKARDNWPRPRKWWQRLTQVFWWGEKQRDQLARINLALIEEICQRHALAAERRREALREAILYNRSVLGGKKTCVWCFKPAMAGSTICEQCSREYAAR